jgi:hypothetical protein
MQDVVWDSGSALVRSANTAEGGSREPRRTFSHKLQPKTNPTIP